MITDYKQIKMFNTVKMIDGSSHFLHTKTFGKRNVTSLSLPGVGLTGLPWPRPVSINIMLNEFRIINKRTTLCQTDLQKIYPSPEILHQIAKTKIACMLSGRSLTTFTVRSAGKLWENRGWVRPPPDSLHASMNIWLAQYSICYSSDKSPVQTLPSVETFCNITWPGYHGNSLYHVTHDSSVGEVAFVEGVFCFWNIALPFREFIKSFDLTPIPWKTIEIIKKRFHITCESTNETRVFFSNGRFVQ